MTAATEQAPRITDEARTQVERAWSARANAQGWKPGSKPYKIAESEFFVGAMTAFVALGYAMDVGWTISLMSGRPVAT